MRESQDTLGGKIVTAQRGPIFQSLEAPILKTGILFAIFLVLFLISLVFGVIRGA